MRIHFIYIVLFSLIFLYYPALSAEDWHVYEHDLTTENLNFVEDDGFFIAGNNGVVLYADYPASTTYDWYPWDDISPPTNEDLYCVADEYGYTYVVGTNGVIIYEDWYWYFVDSPTTKNLYSITLSGELNDEGFIVGEEGTILYGGGEDPEWFLYEPSPTNDNLYSVSGREAGPYPNTTWAVGENGTILDYEDGEWTLYPDSPTDKDLYCVYVFHGGSYDYAWACGANGTILVKEGDDWIEVDTPTNEDLYAIWGCWHPNPDVFCVGANGTILYSYGGYDYHLEKCPVDVDLHGVGGFEDFIWACGENGTILYRDDPPFGNIEPSSIGVIKALFSTEVMGSRRSSLERSIIQKTQREQLIR